MIANYGLTNVILKEDKAYDNHCYTCCANMYRQLMLRQDAF
jgi:hypothetical protein